MDCWPYWSCGADSKRSFLLFADETRGPMRSTAPFLSGVAGSHRDRDTAEAMPRENVEAVQRLIEGFNRRDDDWQAVLAELDPEIAVHDLDISLDAEHFRGHDEVRKWLAVWSDAWGSWRIEGVKVRPVAEDRAIALFLMICKGKGSGIELSRRDALVCTLQARKIVEMTYYNEQQLPQAFEAAGLSEQDFHADPS
jgi:hypothetical protein